MESQITLSVSAIALGGASLSALFGLVSSKRRSARVLSTLTNPIASEQRTQRGQSLHETSIDYANEAARASLKQSDDSNDDVDIFFRAGVFSETARRRMSIFSKMSAISCPVIALSLTYSSGGALPIMATLVGLGIGLQVPRSYLRRAILRRDEEIMFYLPLVIEQLVIGVSSSLDVGPCIRWIVQMADERDSHNAVTELLRYAQQYMKAGTSMENALILVARLSGHTELKHVFMSLSQVSKHGGEITKQLQELANAVSAQREARIEGKIKKLELEATGPVGLVFVAFMATFLSSLALQIVSGLR
jgi:Flp pilus assembly protein TadB